jgi:hypothetical protein
MHTILHTAPKLMASEDPDAALALSALHTTRAAIARWSGKEVPATDQLARDRQRVSPQARWLAETQRGLAAFFECGGFSQGDADGKAAPALLTPTMYRLNACVDP